MVHCGVGTKKKSGLVVFGKAEDCAAAARGYRGPMVVQRNNLLGELRPNKLVVANSRRPGSPYAQLELWDEIRLYHTSPMQVGSFLHYEANQTLFLDEWLAPSSTPRPGALIIHGGGYSTGPFNGCSHAKNMSSFADVAMALARRGFAVVSIDYRCEGPLRAGDPADLFHPWFDAVEDARAAVRYMVSTAARLATGPGR